MERHILLLANSRKLGGRCLAGVEVEYDGDIWMFKLDAHHRPCWIRPVSRLEHGEIGHPVADPLRVMEVVRLRGVVSAPAGYQSENVHFERIDGLGVDHFEIDDLGCISLSSPERTFGNRGNAVHVDHIHDVDHSLLMVEPKDFESYIRNYEDGKHQLRGRYSLAGAQYDQAITDTYFRHGDEKGRHAYLTLSLGLEKDCYHSKLIAAVVLA